jgi:Tol biopolymer transport system component
LRLDVLPLPNARYASPALSPDGALLALDADGVLSLARPDGSDVHSVAAGTAIGAAWSPDGRRFAFVAETAPGVFRLAVAEVATGAVRLLADASPAAGEPAWSPDGTAIVFGRGSPTGYDLFEVAPDGSGEQQLTDVPGANVDPAFSPAR